MFHVPKVGADALGALSPGEREAAERTNERFGAELERLFAGLRGDKAESVWDLRGFQFPTTTLDGYTFSWRVLLDEASFGAGSSFARADLEMGVSFAGATFGGRCSFTWATLGDRCSFSGATLGDDCSFAGARLGDGCLFTWATLGDRCRFDGATIEDCCSFSRAKLGGECSFEAAMLKNGIDFDRLQIDGRVRFDDPDGTRGFLGEAWMTNVTIGKDGALHLRGMNLAWTSFLGTDLSKVTIEDVAWARFETQPRGVRRFIALHRWCLWDELRARQGDFRRTRDGHVPDPVTREWRRSYYKRLATSYRQLVSNLDARRAFEDAEDLHVGELETRRRQLGEEVGTWWAPWLNSYAVYRIASEYGSNLGHALTVLALLTLVVFSLGFMLAGFDVSKEALPASTLTTPPAVVDWDWVWPPVVPDLESVGGWLADYGAAVQLTLSIVSFQRDRFYVPLDGIGRVWLMVAFFVLTGQLALVLFALRRRLKR